MMVLERQKRTALEPLYQLAKTLLPKLEISQQNLNYYASRAFLHDLRSSPPEAGTDPSILIMLRLAALPATDG
jgi:hypothetical protein